MFRKTFGPIFIKVGSLNAKQFFALFLPSPTSSASRLTIITIAYPRIDKTSRKIITINIKLSRHFRNHMMNLNRGAII